MTVLSPPRPAGEATPSLPHRPCTARPSFRAIVAIACGVLGVRLLWSLSGQGPATLAAMSHANWWWLSMVPILSAFSYVMAAVAIRGATRVGVPFGRTVLVQVAAAFTNRLAPAGIGGMATNVRFLELAGTPRPAAIGAVGLNSASGFVVHVVASAATVALLRGRPGGGAVRVPPLPGPGLLVCAVVLIPVAALLWTRRRRVMGWMGSVRRSLGGVSGRPGAVARLLLGSAGVTAGYLLALCASVQAFGGGVSPTRTALVYLGASGLAAASPAPGGLGALEAALVAGLTSLGAPVHSAAAAVLTFRFMTYWLPVLPGWIAFRWLRARGAL